MKREFQIRTEEYDGTENVYNCDSLALANQEYQERIRACGEDECNTTEHIELIEVLAQQQLPVNLIL